MRSGLAHGTHLQVSDGALMCPRWPGPVQHHRSQRDAAHCRWMGTDGSSCPPGCGDSACNLQSLLARPCAQTR